MVSKRGGSVILIDSSDLREVLAARMRMQGHTVTVTPDPAEGAYLALAQPPSVVVADLWMPGISGVQLCRLLGAEPATEHVPVILRGADLDQRSRFWAERAGAAAYIAKGRMGELARAIDRAIQHSKDSDGFFMQLSDGPTEIRDRIAAHLDAALFESVIASEVRGLSVCGEFDRLFDLLSQLVAQVARYRWLAVSTDHPRRIGLHAHPAVAKVALEQARGIMNITDDASVVFVEDEDAQGEVDGPPVIVRPIIFGDGEIGKVAMALAGTADARDHSFVEVLARELAGPLRIAALVEESQRQARVDPLTGLFNRRAFISGLEQEIARSDRSGHALSVMLLDVDHFKVINDRRGHATGDVVLSEMGKLLKRVARTTDIVGRWGGEEFVVALIDTDAEHALLAAERFRREVEKLQVTDTEGALVPVTASFGVTTFRRKDRVDALIDRADRAMYSSKSSGRNRVTGDDIQTANAA